MQEMLKNTAIEVLGASDEAAEKFIEAAVKNANEQLIGDLPEIVKSARESELSKFMEYANEQGTNISFSDMEQGVLDAGRKDIQNSLAKIAGKLNFDKPVCKECGKPLENRGHSKKKLQQR
jgi:hypothetical protein